MDCLAFSHICLLLFFVSGCVSDYPSPDISSAAYMGCYSDVGDYATFIKQLKNVTNVTPAACRKRCGNEDASFIGLWGGTNCWCAIVNPESTTNLKKVDNSKCNRTCSGNISISCGGLSDESDNSIFSVYSVCPKARYGQHCTERCNCKNGNHCSVQGVCPDNKCAPGWTLETKLNRQLCQADVDECSANISRCGDICINSVGSYECSCRTGYELSSDNFSCNDIDECAAESSCAQLCNNTDGSFICSCFSGFMRNESDHRRCNDIDECSTNNGDCNETCSNTDGSYFCSCLDGYNLQADMLSCQEGIILLILSFVRRHYIYISAAIAVLILIPVIVFCINKIKKKRSPKEQKFDLISSSTGCKDETECHLNDYTACNEDTTNVYMEAVYASPDDVDEIDDEAIYQDTA